MEEDTQLLSFLCIFFRLLMAEASGLAPSEAGFLPRSFFGDLYRSFDEGKVKYAAGGVLPTRSGSVSVIKMSYVVRYHEDCCEGRKKYGS